MTKRYANSEQKFLNAIVVYLKAADSIVYYDKVSTTYTNPVPADEMKELFEKGMLVVDTGTSLVRPTVLTEHVTGTVVDYAYVTHTTVSSSTATATSYYSKGYSAG